MRQKITYEAIGLFISDPTGWRQDQNFELINLVQNASFGFNINREEVQEIGNDNLHLKHSYSAPTVNLDFNYLLNQSFLNEKKFGLHRFEQESAFKNFDPHSFDDRNLLFLVSNKDFEELQCSNNYTGYDVMAFGNCFLTNYSVSAGVNSFTSVNASYECANLEFYNYGAQNYIPAINLTGATRSGIGTYQVADTGMSDTNYHMSQRLGLTIDNIYEGGAKLTGNQGQEREGYVQDFNISLNIPRKELLGLGSNHFYNKKVQFPIRGTVSTNVILDEYTSGNFYDLFHDDKTYDFTLRVFPPDQTLQVLAQQGNYTTPTTVKMNVNEGFISDAQSFKIQRKSLFKSISIRISDSPFNFAIVGKDLDFSYKLYEGDGLEGRILQEKSITFTNCQRGQEITFPFDELLTYRGEQYTFAFKWENPEIDDSELFEFGFTYDGYESSTVDVYADGKFYNSPDYDNNISAGATTTNDLMFTGIGVTPLPIYYRIHNAKLDSQSFNYDIGSLSNGSLNFSFECTPETGLEIF